MYKILVVDDDESVRKLVAACLRKTDWSLRQADHAEQALEMAARETPDVALIDIVLPGDSLDGFAVSRALKANPGTRSCRIILMSGWRRPLDPDGLASVGAHAFLEKPFNPMTLRSLISDLMRPSA